MKERSMGKLSTGYIYCIYLQDRESTMEEVISSSLVDRKKRNSIGGPPWTLFSCSILVLIGMNCKNRKSPPTVEKIHE